MRIFDLDLYDGTREELIKDLIQRSFEPFSYAVTPNVDHLAIMRTKSPHQYQFSQSYAHAAVRVCDSKVLKALARLLGKNLFAYPGADLVLDVLRCADRASMRVGIVGPSAEDACKLQGLFTRLQVIHIPSPDNLDVNSTLFTECVNTVRTYSWQILLICLGAPKQEILALELMEGSQNGIAICGGASVDFLTGKQKRAPELMRNLGLEWLYRMLSQPQRLMKRYIYDIPILVKIAIGETITRNK